MLRLPPDLLAEDPLDPAGVALDVSGLLDDDLGLGGAVVLDDPGHALGDGEFERLRRSCTCRRGPSSSSRRS